MSAILVGFPLPSLSCPTVDPSTMEARAIQVAHWNRMRSLPRPFLQLWCLFAPHCFWQQGAVSQALFAWMLVPTWVVGLCLRQSRCHCCHHPCACVARVAMACLCPSLLSHFVSPNPVTSPLWVKQEWGGRGGQQRHQGEAVRLHASRMRPIAQGRQSGCCDGCCGV